MQPVSDLPISYGTYHHQLFFVWIRERVGNAWLGQDDDRTVDGGSEPEDVGVPEEGAPLARDREVIRVNLSGLDRALGDVRRAISPAASNLPNSVPAPAGKFSIKESRLSKIQKMVSHPQKQEEELSFPGEIASCLWFSFQFPSFSDH